MTTMKKILFLLAGSLLVFTAHSQYPDKKAQRTSLKAEQEETIGRSIDSLILIRNFLFIPTELSLRNGGTIPIRQYEYAKVQPGRMYVRMTGTAFEGFFRGNTPYNRCVRNKDKWHVTIQMDYHTGMMTFDFVINRKNADATLKVSTNRRLPKIYRGSIQPN